MNINVKDIVTFDDNKRYLVVSKINYENINYYYLIEVGNSNKVLFCYEDNGDLVEVEDSNIMNTIIPLFLKDTQNHFQKDIKIDDK